MGGAGVLRCVVSRRANGVLGYVFVYIYRTIGVCFDSVFVCVLWKCVVGRRER